MEKKTKIQRAFIGKVISTAMTKTAIVQVDTMKMNQKYQKKYRASKKYHVHDEENKAVVGNKATFIECRPLSKTKRWRLIKVV